MTVGEEIRKHSEKEMVGKTFGWLTVERLATPEDYDDASIKSVGFGNRLRQKWKDAQQAGTEADLWDTNHSGLIWVCRLERSKKLAS